MQGTIKYRYRQELPTAARLPWHAPGQAPLWLGLPVSLLLLLLGWQVLAGNYPAFVLPAPALVWQRFVAAAIEGSLWLHLGVTLLEALSGFGLAFTLAVIAGYLLSRARWLERLVAPQLAMLQAIPVVAVAPLIILWAGPGLWSRILVASSVVFFPMLIASVTALRSIPRELREMAQISGASWWQALRYVELPLALPVLFSGVKSGLALATTGAVVGEFVAGRNGLGALINLARGLFDTPLMFVALLLLVASTLALYLLAEGLERLIVRWETT